MCLKSMLRTMAKQQMHLQLCHMQSKVLILSFDTVPHGFIQNLEKGNQHSGFAIKIIYKKQISGMQKCISPDKLSK